MSSKSDFENFARRREMIVHEDGQVNQRINFLLLAQTFMLVAAVQALTGNNTPSVFLSSLLAGTAAIMIVLTDRTISAARREQLVVKDENARYGDEDAFPIESIKMRECLQADGAPMRDGMVLDKSIPLLLLALWIGVAVYGVYLSHAGLPYTLSVGILMMIASGLGLRWSRSKTRRDARTDMAGGKRERVDPALSAAPVGVLPGPVAPDSAKIAVVAEEEEEALAQAAAVEESLRATSEQRHATKVND